MLFTANTTTTTTTTTATTTAITAIMLRALLEVSSSLRFVSDFNFASRLLSLLIIRMRTSFLANVRFGPRSIPCRDSIRALIQLALVHTRFIWLSRLDVKFNRVHIQLIKWRIRNWKLFRAQLVDFWTWILRPNTGSRFSVRSEPILIQLSREHWCSLAICFGIQ